MGRSALVAALTLAIAAPVMAQQSTAQQQFEAASSLLAQEKWQEAAQAFGALEARLSKGKSSASLAAVRSRKGTALRRLGRYEEAEAAFRSALPQLPMTEPGLREDRYQALSGLAAILERRLAYGEALPIYRAAAEASYDSASKINALVGTVRTGMFFDAQTAFKDADTALSLVLAEHPKDKELRGMIRNLRARVLLNMGRFEEARQELRTATKELGGLTMKVDAADIAARSDNAIASLLSGHKDEAREYLAYTGAGRLEEDFVSGVQMNPPECGEEGLEPDDVAVVEFSILEDGSVDRAFPIYSSRQGNSALVFARAVSGWSWTPETVKKIPLLFRLVTRIEMRCSTADGRPSLQSVLGTDVNAWLEARGVPPINLTEESAARQVKPLMDELAKREASGVQNLALVPVLLALANNPLISSEATVAYLERATTIARAEKAPPVVIAALEIKAQQVRTAALPRWWKKAPNAQKLLADPAIASDVRARAAVRLYEADHLYHHNGKKAEAIAILTEVTGSDLDRNDPLRTGALARLASVQLAAGEAEAARATFAASGLNSEQCALLDTMPKLKRRSISARDYPMEAVRWGFEGWAMIEYDIRSDGKTDKVRTVTAYPPVVFSEAASEILERSVYEQSFRPGGEPGCGGARQPVRFMLPADPG